MPDAHMAMVIVTRLHLLALELEPGTSLHQLIAVDREAIHIAAAS
jgi:hypothetical protein